MIIVIFGLLGVIALLTSLVHKIDKRLHKVEKDIEELDINLFATQGVLKQTREAANNRNECKSKCKICTRKKTNKTTN